MANGRDKLNELLGEKNKRLSDLDILKGARSETLKAFGALDSYAETIKKAQEQYKLPKHFTSIVDSLHFKDPYKQVNERLGSLHGSLSSNDEELFDTNDDDAFSSNENLDRAVLLPPIIKSNETYAIERVQQTAQETNDKIRQLIEIQIETNKANEQFNYKNRTLGLLTLLVVVFSLFLTALIGYGTGRDNQNWQNSQEINDAQTIEILKEIRDK